MARRNAILLLGPTGAGKTPLGELLEQRGFRGKRCFHFDFGFHLRQVAAAGGSDSGLTNAEYATVHDVLNKGALLENESFGIARKLLEAFADRHSATPDDILVMNGLPRHADQARDTDAIVNIAAVVYLECPPDTVHQRIRSNIGGDRTTRSDDSPNEVRRKCILFRDRTLPILAHYREAGAEILRVPVGPNDTPADVLGRL